MNTFGLAGLETGDRLIEAVDQFIGTDLVRQALGGCLVHGLTVDGGRQVDGDEVTLVDTPIHTDQGAEPGAQASSCSSTSESATDRVDLDGERE